MTEPAGATPLREPNSRLWLAFAVVAAYCGCAAAVAVAAASIPNDTIDVKHGLLIRIAGVALSLAMFLLAWTAARRSRGTHAPRAHRRANLLRTIGGSGLVRSALNPGIEKTTAGADPEDDRDAQLQLWVADFYDRYSDWELYKTARIVLLPSRYVHRAIQTVALGLDPI